MSSPDEHLKTLLEGKTRKRQKKPKRNIPIDPSKLGDLCETEPVTIAKLVGYKNASRQLLREDLISLILGEMDAPVDCLQEPRTLIYAYVKANKSIMASLMRCDLHCPACPHHTVMECFTVNRDLVE